MAHIPKAVCLKCNLEYKVEKNGVTMEAIVVANTESLAVTTRPYYKIDSDKWKCPGCGHEILTGFAQHPFLFAHEEERYNSVDADVQVLL